MKSQPSDLSVFLAKHARSRGITMTRFAALCGFSRTSLYRYLRGESPVGEKEEAVFSEQLDLSEEDKAELRAIIRPDTVNSDTAQSYCELNRILFQTYDSDAWTALDFAYYSDGEKYLRTFREMCETIATDCAKENAEIRVNAVNCLSESLMPFFRMLAAGIFGASPFVSFEHLISFSQDDSRRNALILSQLLLLLRYDGYHVLYSPSGRSSSPTRNEVLVDIQTGAADGKAQHTYYSLSLYAEGLSQCIRYNDASIAAYFTANYGHIKKSYRESLLQMRNMQAFNQTLDEFEHTGDYSLFKPDLCYNDVPPSVFNSLFARMTDAEKGETIQLIMGQKLTRSQIDRAIGVFLATMESRFLNTSAHPYRLICCREGLLSFAKTGQLTGNIANFPAFSMQERTIILKALYDRVSQPDGSLSILILRERILADGTIIGVNREKGLLIDFGGVRQRGFSQNALLRCPVLSSLMAEYAYSEELEKKAYSREDALFLISELLNRVGKRSDN